MTRGGGSCRDRRRQGVRQPFSRARRRHHHRAVLRRRIEAEPEAGIGRDPADMRGAGRSRHRWKQPLHRRWPATDVPEWRHGIGGTQLRTADIGAMCPSGRRPCRRARRARGACLRKPLGGAAERDLRRCGVQRHQRARAGGRQYAHCNGRLDDMRCRRLGARPAGAQPDRPRVQAGPRHQSRDTIGPGARLFFRRLRARRRYAGQRKLAAPPRSRRRPAQHQRPCLATFPSIRRD